MAASNLNNDYSFYAKTRINAELALTLNTEN